MVNVNFKKFQNSKDKNGIATGKRGSQEYMIMETIML
jgi:hypothetical protein